MTKALSVDYSFGVTFDLAKHDLSIAKSIILDTPCYYQAILDQGVDLSSGTIFYKHIECVVDDFELINQRLQSRTFLEVRYKLLDMKTKKNR